MKKLTSLTVLFGGAVATLLLAVGLNNAAQKMDPVAQKSIPISTMQTGEIAALPCAPCSGDDPPPEPDLSFKLTGQNSGGLLS